MPDPDQPQTEETQPSQTVEVNQPESVEVNAPEQPSQESSPSE